MTGSRKAFHIRSHWLAISFLIAAALIGASFMSSRNASANHPVLVEGNCDSPFPNLGTAEIVGPDGTCGDYDGDGRVGILEDTDGADRVFGTINAALGNGTGPAAGTGANHNGTVTIVSSGRFAELIYIGQGQPFTTQPGIGNPGHVTLEAAPGVEANIDAVLQGDPAGGNTQRQAGIGIRVVNFANNRRVVLRNLTIRNFQIGVSLEGNARVTIDNCRLENNQDYGIRLQNDARVNVFNTTITATGFRIPPIVTPNPGHAIAFEGGSAGNVFHSLITGSFGAAIFNGSSTGTVRYYEVFLGPSNGQGIVGGTHQPTP